MLGILIHLYRLGDLIKLQQQLLDTVQGFQGLMETSTSQGGPLYSGWKCAAPSNLQPTSPLLVDSSG